MQGALEFSIKYLFGEKHPKEQNFLIIEDINTKGELLLLQLIQEYISNDYNTVLVLLDSIPQNILEELVVKESENFAVVNTCSDLYSRYYTSMKLHELNLTLKSLRKKIKGEKKLAIFTWSLNPLFIYYSSPDVIHFYLENVKHAVENNTTEYYLIDKGIIDEMAMRRLIAIAHCVLQLEKDNTSENVFNIAYLKTTGMAIKKNKIRYKYQVKSSLWESKIWLIDHL
ncbi:MAG: hypothetical protein ACTSYB_14425 [Candidatus Helarchaeota archaeon]